jgi:VWFA-related protein
MVSKKRCGVLIFILFCSCTGFAQPTPPAQPDVTQPVSTRISLDVVVAPKNGKPVAGLKEQDFTILDNQVPQKITSFRALAVSDGELETIVVVDSVNTGYTSVAYAHGEIDKFFQANGGQLAYPAQLAIFSDTGLQVQQGFSKDGNAIASSLDKYTVGLRAIGRSAGFYGDSERLQLSIRMLHQLAAYGATLPGRKLVLWISPGWPILSGPQVQLSQKQQQSIFDTIVQVSTELRQARITLYSVDPLGTADTGMRTSYYRDFLKGIRRPRDTEYGNLALQVIATQTGGLVLNSNNDVASLLQQAMADDAAYYALSFDPASGEPNEYHELQIKVAEPGLIARTRSSYYSPR